MRILVGHIYHESNTFCPEMTRLDQFECFTGDRVPECVAGADVLRAAGAEVIPSVYAQRWSSGTVEKAAFDTFLGLLLEAARRERGRLDGVFLSLHGGMTVQDTGSGEYRILEALRREIGYDIPVAVSMDMHANLQPGIGRFANVLTGYHTAPHTDEEETQRKAARALLRLIRSGERVTPQFAHLPMLLVGERALSKDEPFRTLYAACEALEKDERILAATVFIGMAWSDTPNTAASVCVTPSAPEHAPFALEKARELGKTLFDRREECPYAHPAFEPDEAVRRALASPRAPVYLSDSGDNPTAGGVGDSTELLRLFAEDGSSRRVLFAPILDAAAYARAASKAEGEKFSLSVGTGREAWCRPITLEAEMIRRREILAPHGRSVAHVADAALIRCGSLDVALVDRQMAFTCMECFSCLEISPGDYDIVVLKMGYMFAEISSPCRENLMALTPGSTPLKITPEQYHRLKRPIWPLDEDVRLGF